MAWHGIGRDGSATVDRRIYQVIRSPWEGFSSPVLPLSLVRQMQDWQGKTVIERFIEHHFGQARLRHDCHSAISVDCVGCAGFLPLLIA